MIVYSPAKGFGFNPLRSFRNIPCPCGANKKAKRCHGRLEFLPEGEIVQVKEYLRKLSAAGFIEARPSEIA